MEKKTVYYKDFGAVGDGVAEDFWAIKKCHEYANEHGYDVKADAGATYYICETDGEEIPVMTNVDWVDATFIMDDAKIDVPSKSRTKNIFVMTSKYPRKSYGADSDVVKAINANGGIVPCSACQMNAFCISAVRGQRILPTGSLSRRRTALPIIWSIRKDPIFRRSWICC